jgi:hypothetical protein
MGSKEIAHIRRLSTVLFIALNGMTKGTQVVMIET